MINDHALLILGGFGLALAFALIMSWWQSLNLARITRGIEELNEILEDLRLAVRDDLIREQATDAHKDGPPRGHPPTPRPAQWPPSPLSAQKPPHRSAGAL
jgi:hypothetical protein